MKNLIEDDQEVVEEDFFGKLEKEEGRRRSRMETWLDDQTYTCTLPETLPNPFNLSLLQEAYIYSSQVRTKRSYNLHYHIRWCNFGRG